MKVEFARALGSYVISLGLIGSTTLMTITDAQAGDTSQNSQNSRSSMIPYERYGTSYRDIRDNPAGFNGPNMGQEDTGVEEVRIGLFGPSKEAGMSLRRGAQMAIDEQNASGGYQGIPFRLVFRADDGLWGAGAGQMVKLIYEDHVWAVVGSIGGSATHIAEQIATKAWVPLITPAATDPTLTQTNVPWIFRCMPDDRQQAMVLAEYLFHVKGYRKVAGLSVNNHYGKYGMVEFESLAQRMGSPLALSLKYHQGDSDFSRQIALLERSGVQAVVIWGTPKESALFLRQMREYGMKQAVFGSVNLAVPEFLETAGNFAEDVIVTLPYDYSRHDTAIQVFRDRFYARYGQEPDMFATYGYDAARIIVEAIRTVGLNRVRIRDALMTMTDFHGVTGEFTFDKTGNNTALIKLAVIVKGHFSPF